MTNAIKVEKLPVVIDALQYTGTRESRDEIRAWARGDISVIVNRDGATNLYLHRADGLMEELRDGDWLMTGLHGEFYRVEAKHFDTYFRRK